MNDQETSFAEFIIEMMIIKGYTNNALAAIAGVSNRAVVEARHGLLEKMLSGGEISLRKRNGVSHSTLRLLRALDADEEYWLKRLGLDANAMKTAVRNIRRSPQTLTSKLGQLMDKPVDGEHVTRINKVHRALGAMFTTEMLFRILLRETE